ncbi:ATP-dependent Clp protease proteolytic subunit [Microcoleus sp. FACHB-1515]|uniref:ATP-dependent Clp protease proteolytic subunit n=1 Tax=Cyanophyceae TaxID=3028117 RepID=UPI0016868758|nr:ATP-dependent Clp protease proteolytic subunit [Microcoleus sp. FACHB-1515]MBD2092224.1 ATP-dependent Clp protease proteolytic subunit [Microcoleus sp. FACHB-1515]
MSVDGTLRVPYNLPGTQYWQWVNIYTRLSQERIIFLNQPLTDGVANSIVSAMLYLESDDSTKPILLYINSIGDPVLSGMASVVAGSVSILAGLAIYDTMTHIKSPVHTICLGQAVGMSAMLLSAGKKGQRLSLPHASIVLDHPKMGSQGQATDIQVMSQEVLAKKNLVLEILSETTGQPIEKIRQDTERTLYMTPDQAQEYGLVDRVLTNTKLPEPSLTLP